MWKDKRREMGEMSMTRSLSGDAKWKTDLVIAALRHERNPLAALLTDPASGADRHLARHAKALADFLENSGEWSTPAITLFLQNLGTPSPAAHRIADTIALIIS